MEKKRISDGTTSLTVLALHGYRQTSDALARPLGRLLKMRTNQPDIDIVYPVAPVVVVARDSADVRSPEEGPLRAWWARPTYNLDDRFDYKEFGPSCDAVAKALDGKTADVVVAFSQGAVMATLLLQSGKLPDCKCAVLFGASGVQDPTLATLPVVCGVPALIVSGEKDSLCGAEGAQQLGAAYADARYITHRWGHVVPSDSASREIVTAFIAASCLADSSAAPSTIE